MTPLLEMAAKKAAEYVDKFENEEQLQLAGAEMGYSDGYVAGAREWVAMVALKNAKIERLKERVKELEGEKGVLLKAVNTVLNGYELDGMENMRMRDEVFFEQCTKAIAALNSNRSDAQNS